ncbi:MAG: ribosome maturation factor RimP [Frankiales bacterium]|nr:ribosome maturation factor RimP [Frankiales bacterium]
MSARPPKGRRPPEPSGRRPSAPARSGRSSSSAARGGADRRDAVVALLTPVVGGAGLDLEDVELRTVGRRLVLRVLVDTDGGVSLDQVAAASQAVSEALDSSDVLGDEPYTLEVSSPGVERPLTLPRHWRRALGRLVEATHDSGRRTTGRVAAATDDEVTLEVAEKGRTRQVVLPLASVTRAVVQVEFTRAAADEPDDTDDTEDTGDTQDAGAASGGAAADTPDEDED